MCIISFDIHDTFLNKTIFFFFKGKNILKDIAQCMISVENDPMAKC